MQASGPADGAGIQDGDIVVRIDGVAVDGPDELGEAVRSHQPGDVVDVVVERDGAEQTIPVGLGANTDEGSPDVRHGAARRQQPDAGRVAGDVARRRRGVQRDRPVPDGVGVDQGRRPGAQPGQHLNHLSGETDDLATRPTTVVGVTQVSGTVGDAEGFIGVLFLLAALNVFVGVFNMFPLLPLDGGHAAIATYERVRERGGRRYFADVSKLMPFAMGVIVVLLALFMSGLYLDITQPLR